MPNCEIKIKFLMARRESFNSSLLHTDESMDLEDLILEKEEQIVATRLKKFRVGQ
jgi:hypothetical protein